MRRWVLLMTGLLVLGFLAINLSRYQIDVLITPLSESSAETTPELGGEVPPPPDAQAAVVAPTPGSPLWKLDTSGIGVQATGFVRVSNQTQHPIRVLILEQPRPGKKQSVASSPSHWDFAPAEGSQQGVILSLPGGNVTLHPGDIIMAYAQDGTALDWGPYIIGKTQQPIWNSRMKEWQLIVLKP